LTHDSRYASRQCKSQKVLAILQDYLGPDLINSHTLDVGCASGGITVNLAPDVHYMVGIDLDQPAVEQANQSNSLPNLEYAIASGSQIPFTSECFDLLICAQVYEHVDNQVGLVSEIWRVLRPGGVCFFSGPNRLAVTEEHYWLPFLSWLPRSLANIYMRIFRRGTYYDAHPLTYWQIRRLLRSFTIIDYTIQLLRDPDKFASQEKLRKYSWISKLPLSILKGLTPIFPNYNWVLLKSDDDRISSRY
jgi:2-polyprenyl-3-methyl-5-hydroxy-6-metoxy-1,4-benzoquinol methylase